jgi:hypothetical protein
VWFRNLSKNVYEDFADWNTEMRSLGHPIDSGEPFVDHLITQLVIKDGESNFRRTGQRRY